MAREWGRAGQSFPAQANKTHRVYAGVNGQLFQKSTQNTQEQVARRLLPLLSHRDSHRQLNGRGDTMSNMHSTHMYKKESDTKGSQAEKT